MHRQRARGTPHFILPSAPMVMASSFTTTEKPCETYRSLEKDGFHCFVAHWQLEASRAERRR